MSLRAAQRLSLLLVGTVIASAHAAHGTTPTPTRTATPTRTQTATRTATATATTALITVDTSMDLKDTNPGNGVCTTTAGKCSLRAAVQEANELPGPVVIHLQFETNPKLSITGTGEDAAAKGDLDITKDLTITGMGNVVDAAGIDRAFQILPGVHVTMDGVTIRNGNPGADLGGAIYNSGELTLMNVTINNSSALNGGAIENAAGGVLILSAVTIQGNSATLNDGGGIENRGTATLANVTMTGNAAPQGSGGNIENRGTMTVTNVTAVGGSALGGAGISNLGTVALKNTILGNNSGGNCVGAISSLGHNLEDGTGCGFGGSGDLSNTDPQLGPLQDNGGAFFLAPFTELPARTSPAIDAGDNDGCPSSDERGVVRPLDGNGDALAVCDIGAVELTPPTIFTVNSTTDAVDAAPGDGLCMTDGGLCTLRAAIQEANHNTDEDGATIQVPAGMFTLTIPPSASAEPAGAGALGVVHTLTVTGAGRDQTVVDGNALDAAVLYSGLLFSTDPPPRLMMSGLTIQNGGTVNGIGAGIQEAGGLTLVNVRIARNRGVGVTAFRRLTVSDAIIDHNDDAGLSVTNLFIGGTAATLSNVTISDNARGGIVNDGATLTLADMAISGNSMKGGLRNLSAPSASLTNVTISGNSAVDAGGGIYHQSTTLMTLTNVTISGNSAPSASALFNGSGSLQVRNVIVADNQGGPASNCFGTITSLGHNLDDGTSCAFEAGGDLSNTNPQLGSLQDNGGPTLTEALTPTSPAVDAGDNTGCPASDQRGAARPADGNDDHVQTCDIGAFELQPHETPAPSPSPTATALATPTPTSTVIPTASPTRSATAAASHTPTAVASASPSVTATPTLTPIPTNTATAPSTTQTSLPSSTATITSTPMPSASGTSTFTPTGSPTSTPTSTLTATSAVASATIPEPTPPPTSTPTQTVSSSPTLTPVPTATVTPTATERATDTPSASPTDSPTSTASAAPSRTLTETATATPSATVTATATAVPIPTATPSCIGDCDGNGAETIDEILLGVNIVLGDSQVEACPSFDVDGSGTVTVDELLLAVNAAFNGCR